MPPPKRVFIGSAQADAAHVETLKKHLKLYERQNLIQIWDESMLIPGETRNSKIEQELHSAEIILLLISSDLLAEDFIWGTEMNKILEKVKRKEVQLIPILLRSSTFSDTPFAAYAAVPDREKPISNYTNKDEAWTIVVEQIKRCIQSKPTPSPEPQNPTSSMIPQTLIDEVNNLIGKGHSDKALDALIRWAHANNQSQLKSDASIIKSSLETLKREEMLGMLSFSEASRELAKINNSLMNLLKMVATAQEIVNTAPTFVPVNPSNDKLKILMMTANPASTTKLNLDKEHSRIAEELQKAPEKFNLVVKRSVNQTEFQQFAELETPYVLHFSGHGERSIGDETGGIVVWDDDNRKEAKIGAEALDALFEYLIDDIRIPLNLVVLNACHSEEQAAAIAQHVPYVIGTTVAIEDDAAISFSVGFYFQLAKSNDLELSYKSGRTRAVVAGAKKTYFVLYKNGAKVEA